MTEKKDPNAWIDKERQKIQDEVIRPMREQLEEQIKAIYLQAAQRYHDVKNYGKTDVKADERKEGSWKFMDCYKAGDDAETYYEDLVRLCHHKAYVLADEMGQCIEHEYDGWFSSFVDAITAHEVREEEKEREQRNAHEY